jgi:peroxiredoxin
MARVIAALVLLGAPVQAAPPAAAAEAPVAPSFRVRTATGQTIDLTELRSRGPVLIDFWATWCKPCLVSLPELNALHRRFGPRGLTIIGVSVDGPRNFPKVRPAAQRLGLEFSIVIDEDGSLQQRFQARAVPTSVLVASDGRIVRVTQGWRPGETRDLEAAIEALFPDSTAAP